MYVQVMDLNFCQNDYVAELDRQTTLFFVNVIGILRGLVDNINLFYRPWGHREAF